MSYVHEFSALFWLGVSTVKQPFVIEGNWRGLLLLNFYSYMQAIQTSTFYKCQKMCVKYILNICLSVEKKQNLLTML